MIILLMMLIGFLEATVGGLTARGTSFPRTAPRLQNHVSLQLAEALSF